MSYSSPGKVQLYANSPQYRAPKRHRWLDTHAHSHAFDRQALALAQSEIAEGFLSVSQAQISEEVREWIVELAQHCQRDLSAQRAKWAADERELQVYKQLQVDLVDEMVAWLTFFTRELNELMGGSLQMSVTRPSFVTEVVRSNYRREPVEQLVTYRARLSTRHLSLVIRSYQRSVTVFILPATHTLGLTKAEAAYQPITQITASIRDDSITWQVTGCGHESDNVTELCQAIFQAFVNNISASGIGESRPAL